MAELLSDEDADKYKNIHRHALKDYCTQSAPPSGRFVNFSALPPHKWVKNSKSDVFSRESFYIFFISCFWVKHLQKYTRKEP